MKASMEKYMSNIEMLQEGVTIHVGEWGEDEGYKKGWLCWNVQRGKIYGLIVKWLKYNLLSVRKLAQNNYKVTFDMKSVEVVNKNHKLYCKRKNNLYMYILKLSPKKDKVCVGFEASRTQKAEI